MTFTEYVAFYGLARSEGLVLRYLADAYKALRQTVPDEAKTEELADLIEWLGELVRQVDSSLLDEWEELRDPAGALAAGPSRSTDRHRRRSPATRGPSGCWCATRCSAGSSWPRSARYAELGELDGEAGWDADGWERGRGAVLRRARRDRHRPGRPRPALLILDEGPQAWLVRQIFDDPAGDHDWGISAEVDLAASDEAGEAVVRVTEVGQL